jgi:hypothetical protein
MHYHVKQWPQQGEMMISEKNVAPQDLVDNRRIHLPLIHIKFGLIKIFVEAMHKEGEGSIYLSQNFLA